MKRFLRGAVILSLLASSAASQDKKQPDDVLQKKDGGIVVGRITKLDNDWVEIQVAGEKEARKVSLKDLYPSNVYRIRLDRIDKNSAEARMALGEFCMTNNLYFLATREFDEAARLDKSFEEKSKKRREEAHHEDARSRFEDAKRLA